MSLSTVQDLMTRVMRDEDFRNTVREGGVDALAGEYLLADDERRALSSVDPDHLEKAAQLVFNQRVRRREAEYALFLNHLFLHTDRDAFLRSYHQATPVGQWQRLEEARRFVDFSFAYVLEHTLPEYLVDVLRFCLQVLEMAETPKVKPGGAFGLGDAEHVTASTSVMLRRPFSIASYTYDVLLIAGEDEVYAGHPVPRAKRVVLQRDWRQPKRARAFATDEHPLIASLMDGPATVLDLAGRFPQFSARQVLDLVRDLSGRQIVHLARPPELAR